jgi:hypothetical protein
MLTNIDLNSILSGDLHKTYPFTGKCKRLASQEEFYDTLVVLQISISTSFMSWWKELYEGRISNHINNYEQY